VPIVPFASVAFDFDPLLRLGDSGVRLETLALAGSILLALALAAFIAGRTPVQDPHSPLWATGVDLHLRRDDLLFIVLGVIPGAVVGGRLGYVLLHLDYYTAHPAAIADPSQGSLELGLGVLAGTLTGAYVARLLEAPVRRWLHAATIPTFTGIAFGELSRLLGGSGQGAASDLPWATAYLGAGPWETLVPATPAHPAQLYGALAAVVAVVVVALLLWIGALRAHDGSAFFVALLVWAVVRSLVTLTWRDDVVLGPLRAGGLIALGVALAALIGVAVTRIAARRARRQAHGQQPEPDRGVDWPDPDARGRF
jgi:phosphatidylglycerol:prolipoprotein diacylglycerol transferase